MPEKYCRMELEYCKMESEQLRLELIEIKALVASFRQMAKDNATIRKQLLDNHRAAILKRSENDTKIK